MSTNERDRKFQNFARLEYPELKPLFRELFAANLERNTGRAEQAERMIKLTLARRAYDLVYHTLDTPGVCYAPGALDLYGSDYVADTDEIIKSVTDLTEWPPG